MSSAALAFSELNDLPEVPDRIDGIDVAEGVKKMLGKRKLYGKVLYAFFRENLTKSKQLQQTLTDGDFKLLAEELHKIKGTAGIICATRIYQLSGSLYTQITAGDEEIGPELTQFCDELQNVLQSLQKIYAEY